MTARGDSATARGDRAGMATARGDRAAAPPIVVGVGCSLGCPPGELAALVDAALAGTRGAVKQMQIKFGMPADSYPTAELLNALRGRTQSSLE